MTKMRKITVTVRRSDLEAAQAYTGKGITKTVLEGLKKLASIDARLGPLKRRGEVTLSTSLIERRRERE